MYKTEFRQAYYRSLMPLVHWPRLTPPVNWEEEFARSGPLELEIGFGNGEALVQRSEKRPESNHIGIEISWESIKRALRRLAAMGSSNVRLLQIDAHLAMLRLFTPRSVQQVLALFPAPWPKDRHVRRRLFSTSFLQILGNRLVDTGEFKIVTDYQPLADWILTQVPETGLVAQLSTTPARFQTKYERKWLDNGQDIFYELTLSKQRHIEAPDVEDFQLLSVRLKNFHPDTFKPIGQQGLITIKFEEYLYDPQRRKALVRTFIAEERLIQEVYLQIVDRGEYWHLGLDHVTNVVPTTGVRRAVELLSEAAGL
ncbi:MAG: tRNA (guanosine(46)-N7)-methyltransferase TrmB [Deltaproteobacteria bacterium]|nr:tRNA (guanosine(46)-N7)-methyltransferase TrmB [Deltaproteobacteria bacterium]